MYPHFQEIPYPDPVPLIRSLLFQYLLIRAVDFQILLMLFPEEVPHWLPDCQNPPFQCFYSLSLVDQSVLMFHLDLNQESQFQQQYLVRAV